MVTVASITHTMTCTPSKRHTHKHTSQLVHIHLHPLNTVIQIHPNTRNTHKWNEIQQVSQWLLGGSHGSTVPPYRHPSWANSGLGWGCKDHNHHFGMPNRHLWMAVAFLFPFGTTPVMNTMESPHSLWTTSSEWYGLSSFLWTTPALIWIVWIVHIPVAHTNFEWYGLFEFLWTTQALNGIDYLHSCGPHQLWKSNNPLSPSGPHRWAWQVIAEDQQRQKRPSDELHCLTRVQLLEC